MMTPFERVVGDSSKDHTVTAPTFTTRPTTVQLHHYAGLHCVVLRCGTLRRVLRRHMGQEVRVDSDVGGGCKWWVCHPLSPADPSPRVQGHGILARDLGSHDRWRLPEQCDELRRLEECPLALELGQPNHPGTSMGIVEQDSHLRLPPGGGLQRRSPSDHVVYVTVCAVEG